MVQSAPAFGKSSNQQRGEILQRLQTAESQVHMITTHRFLASFLGFSLRRRERSSVFRRNGEVEDNPYAGPALFLVLGLSDSPGSGVNCL